jgi:hypothetical protein
VKRPDSDAKEPVTPYPPWEACERHGSSKSRTRATDVQADEKARMNSEAGWHGTGLRQIADGKKEMKVPA